jgi:hypothetical protein
MILFLLFTKKIIARELFGIANRASELKSFKMIKIVIQKEKMRLMC